MQHDPMNLFLSGCPQYQRDKSRGAALRQKSFMSPPASGIFSERDGGIDPMPIRNFLFLRRSRNDI
jgi:hypothetical protein